MSELKRFTVTDVPADYIAGKPNPGAGENMLLTERQAQYEISRGLLKPAEEVAKPLKQLEPVKGKR